MKNIIYLFVLTLAFVACEKEPEINTIIETPILDPPKKEVLASVSGQVTDENGEFVSEATIDINGKMTITDRTGHFSFNNVNLFADGSYAVVRKDGYFDGSRKFYATQNDENYLEVQLIEKVMKGQVSSNLGGTVEVDGATINLPSGIYENENQTYEGEVLVFAKWLDPTKAETFQEMPGDLTGIDANGDLQGLTTYGMISVELTDEVGNEISLPQNTKATINIPVPEEIIGSAPSTIPLWHFDEINGTWIEEGSAELVNGAYIGEVAHFSFWNCDDPFPTIDLAGTIHYNGSPILGARLKVTDLSINASAYAVTNASGKFNGKVPSNRELSLSIQDACGTELSNYDLGSLTVDTDIGIIDFDINYGDFNLSGIVTNCITEDLGPSYVVIDVSSNPRTFKVQSDGTYSAMIDNCSGGSVFVHAVDPLNLLMSLPQEVTASGNVNLDIEVCEQLTSTEIPIIIYDNMDWGLALGTDLIHSYSTEIIPVGNGTNKYVYTVAILDWLTGEIAEGTFAFADGDTEASYTWSIPQGFDATGVCPITNGSDGRILSGTTTDITVTDPAVYPGNVGEVFFSVTID